MGSGTGIGRVRGLGSARHGAHHWLAQRYTAVGNLLLVLWLIFSLVSLPGLDYESVRNWIANPLVAVPLQITALADVQVQEKVPVKKKKKRAPID